MGKFSEILFRCDRRSITQIVRKAHCFWVWGRQPIRPRDRKHPLLLSVGEPAHFRLPKGKVLLRVEDGDGKQREYVVLSMTPRDSRTTAASISHPNHAQ